MAWLPWEPFPNANIGRQQSDPSTVREGAQRAAVLAGRGYWVVSYGEELIDTGDLGRAAAVAAIAGSASLSVRVMRAEGQLRGALDTAASTLARIPARPDTSTDAARLVLEASDLSLIFEQQPTYMQDFFDRFLVPEPSPLSRGVVPFFAVIGSCLATPKPLGARCISRMGELFRGGHFGAAYLGAAEILAGAERYEAGDLAGAAKAWRTALSRTILASAMTHSVLADLFDRVGDPEVGDRADALWLKDGAPPSLALARAASRAVKRGDCATAKHYAQRLVDKWETADEKPPVLERLRKLIARCASAR